MPETPTTKTSNRTDQSDASDVVQPPPAPPRGAKPGIKGGKHVLPPPPKRKHKIPPPKPKHDKSKSKGAENDHVPPPPPRGEKALSKALSKAVSKGGAVAKKNAHPPPAAKRKHKKHDKSKAKTHPEGDSTTTTTSKSDESAAAAAGEAAKAGTEEVGAAIAIGCYVVAKKGSRNEQRGHVIAHAAGKKWKVQWDNDDGKANPGTYRGINLQVVNAGADEAKKTAPKKKHPPKRKHKVGMFKPGATVKSIATTGTRKGMRGTLVKSIDKALGTWEVKWSNGKPGKAYPESKLKVIKDSE